MDKVTVSTNKVDVQKKRYELANALLEDYHVLNSLIYTIDALPRVQKIEDENLRVRYHMMSQQLGTYFYLLQGISERLDVAVGILGEEDK